VAEFSQQLVHNYPLFHKCFEELAPLLNSNFNERKPFVVVKRKFNIRIQVNMD